MHVAASSDHPRLPPFELYAPATMDHTVRTKLPRGGGGGATMSLPKSRPESFLYGPPIALPRSPLNRAMVPRTCLNRIHA
ncbi:mucin-5AC-like [Dorcoceras hygrometricum]|uniref:Mucin-5AC-like n=1 Tax=Dorcoceras hygrometricum TaxID=472368 RepID=A0A2Z6ZZY1_9LAMI|nr:mucin-5AC-like [Dorcoceras hygrometricum]